ncbi:hypothetical protein ACWDZ4_33085 [Streptomyces sp. NPDC003016]
MTMTMTNIMIDRVTSVDMSPAHPARPSRPRLVIENLDGAYEQGVTLFSICIIAVPSTERSPLAAGQFAA